MQYHFSQLLSIFKGKFSCWSVLWSSQTCLSSNCLLQASIFSTRMHLDLKMNYQLEVQCSAGEDELQLGSRLKLSSFLKTRVNIPSLGSLLVSLKWIDAGFTMAWDWKWLEVVVAGAWKCLQFKPLFVKNVLNSKQWISRWWNHLQSEKHRKYARAREEFFAPPVPPLAKMLEIHSQQCHHLTSEHIISQHSEQGDTDKPRLKQVKWRDWRGCQSCSLVSDSGLNMFMLERLGRI